MKTNQKKSIFLFMKIYISQYVERICKRKLLSIHIVESWVEATVKIRLQEATEWDWHKTEKMIQRGNTCFALSEYGLIGS